MSTEAQIIANQANSLKSTGPSTEAGKAASAKNATSHGLSAKGEAYLPHEDRAQYDALRDSYWESFTPSTPHEEFLLGVMFESNWRYQRAGRIEQCLILEDFDSPEGKMAQSMSAKGDPYPKFQRYKASILRDYNNASNEYRRAVQWKIEADADALAEQKFAKLFSHLMDRTLEVPQIQQDQNEANLPEPPAEKTKPAPAKAPANVTTYVRETPKIGRNEPCPCGSGMKFKKCCLDKPKDKPKAA